MKTNPIKGIQEKRSVKNDTKKIQSAPVARTDSKAVHRCIGDHGEQFSVHMTGAGTRITD